MRSPGEIEKVRHASLIVAEVLEDLKQHIQPGVTTWELNVLSEELAKERKALPAFKGYLGYPFALCASINEEVVHGMPSRKRFLNDGDIVSLDFGVVIDGYFGDAAITAPVGKISEEAKLLCSICEQALYQGIQMAVSGNRLSDISHAIQAFAERNGYSVVREFVGHGIGRNLHESPKVPNYGKPGKGVRLRPGMVLAVEPLINAGRPEVRMLRNRWTAITLDRKLSSHFEHTVAVTQNGVEILTQLDKPLQVAYRGV